MKVLERKRELEKGEEDTHKFRETEISGGENLDIPPETAYINTADSTLTTYSMTNKMAAMKFIGGYKLIAEKPELIRRRLGLDSAAASSIRTLCSIDVTGNALFLICIQ